jgi:hypothetical protein
MMRLNEVKVNTDKIEGSQNFFLSFLKVGDG